MTQKSDAKLEEKLTCDLEKDMKNMANFHLKVLNLGLWWNSLIQSRKSMSLKFTVGLCVMTINNDAKFEEELTGRFKTDMGNLINFDPSTWNSQTFSL